ncbi:MAG: hypothetical protein EHM63_09820 [Actinobacteria bacterium]|nr:MAG: hypothetical protein EHM63_09820 [Actinomycetota bacterium]
MTITYGDSAAPVPDPNEQIADLVRQVSDLQDRLEAAMRDRGTLSTELMARAARVNELSSQRDAFSRDIGIIADALREEAISRDWCSDYGVFVDGLNCQTSQPWLQHCMEDRVATFVVSFRYSVRHGRNDTVTEAFRESLRESGGYDMPGDSDLTDIDVTLNSDVVE